MTTFSQLVDHVVADTGRPNLTSRVARYLNQVVREVHADAAGAMVLYPRNLVEDLLTANVSAGFSWAMPKQIQFIKAVRYDSVFSQAGHPVYAKGVSPGPALNRFPHAFYQSGSSIFFQGYGGLNATIAIGYYTFLPSLLYFPAATRPGEYDASGAFVVNPNFVGTEDDARALTTHWLLERWGDTVLYEGALAKTFKGVDESNDRSRNTFSVYNTMRESLVQVERATVVN